MESTHSKKSQEQNGIEMAVNISMFFLKALFAVQKNSIFNHFILHTVHVLTRQNLQRICTLKLSGGYRAASQKKMLTK